MQSAVHSVPVPVPVPFRQGARIAAVGYLGVLCSCAAVQAGCSQPDVPFSAGQWLLHLWAGWRCGAASCPSLLSSTDGTADSNISTCAWVPLGPRVAGLSPSWLERVNATAAVNGVRAQQVVEVGRGEVKAAQSDVRTVPKYDRGLDRPTTPKTRTQDENRPTTGPIGLVGVCGDGEVSRSISASALPLHLMCFASSTRLLPASPSTCLQAAASHSRWAARNQRNSPLHSPLCTPKGDPGRTLLLGHGLELPGRGWEAWLSCKCASIYTLC
jgi:hypothetical protein